MTYLPVDSDGLVDPAALAAALTPDTVLVSVMPANNETGALQPIAELARIAHAHGALFHCDAAQAAGKIPLDVTALGRRPADDRRAQDVRAQGRRRPVRPRRRRRSNRCVYGGGQEHGLRAGTENVALAVALGTAADLAAEDLADGGPERIAALRDRLHHGLADALPGRVHLNGPADRACPTPSTSASTASAATNSSPPSPRSPPPPARPATAATTEPSPVLQRHGPDPTPAASPRSGSRSAAGPPRTTSTGPPS